MENKKLHWHCFVFVDGLSTVTIYSGCEDKNITLRRINENKKSAGVNKGAALTNCIYLGKMTRGEFVEE